jgi:hypothetical protein
VRFGGRHSKAADTKIRPIWLVPWPAVDRHFVIKIKSGQEFHEPIDRKAIKTVML